VKPKDYGKAVEGATVMLIGKMYQDSKYFEIHAKGGMGTMVENMPAEGMKDKVDTSERILRGMVFNDVCTILAHESPTDDQILTRCQQLYNTMKDWLTK
jgi:hypothetical protein